MNQEVDSNRDARRSIAIHEAGHAVAAVRLKIPLATVTIVPTDEYQGATMHSLVYLHTLMRALDGYPVDDEDEEEPQHPVAVATDGIVLLRAGRLAEELICGRIGPEATYEHDESSVTEIVSRVCMSFDEGNAFDKWVDIRARRCVRVWRKQIEAVADALLTAGTLDEDGVHKAMFAERKQETA